MARIINNCAKLLMCHSKDLLDVNVLESKIVPNVHLANLKQLLNDTMAIYHMQAEQNGIRIESKL